MGSQKCVATMIPQFGYISQMKVNCAGNKVALLIATEECVVIPKLYILDTEQDSINYFNFETGLSEIDDYISAKTSEAAKALAESRKCAAYSYQFL